MIRPIMNQGTSIVSSKRPDRSRRTIWLSAVVWLLVARVGSVSAKEPAQLGEWLDKASRDAHYQRTSPTELAQIEGLFRRTLQNPAHDEGLAAEWAGLGWSLRRIEWQQEPLWIVTENSDHRRGGGFFVVRPRYLPGIVLEMPHSFADEHTRIIGLRMFLEGTFAAAAWNTIHREKIDVAHVAEHPFSAFTRAVALESPSCYFAQLHGFSQEKRTTPSGRDADLIVSNGDEAPEIATRRLATLFQSSQVVGQVRLFPTEISELGATTNVQADLLRQLGNQQFVHLEMSEPLRLRLAADRRVRRVFLKSLADLVD